MKTDPYVNVDGNGRRIVGLHNQVAVLNHCPACGSDYTYYVENAENESGEWFTEHWHCAACGEEFQQTFDIAFTGQQFRTYYLSPTEK